MELVFDVIIIIRLFDGRYYEVNEVFCQQIGYICYEIIGWMVFDLSFYVDIEECKCFVEVLCIEGVVIGMWVIFRYCDGLLLYDIVLVCIICFKGQDCFLVVCILINLLVEVQDVLKESEKKFWMIFNVVLDFICFM